MVFLSSSNWNIIYIRVCRLLKTRVLLEKATRLFYFARVRVNIVSRAHVKHLSLDKLRLTICFDCFFHFNADRNARELCNVSFFFHFLLTLSDVPVSSVALDVDICVVLFASPLALPPMLS